MISTRRTRSESAPARCSSSTVAPACSESEQNPSASGGAAAVAITRGAMRAAMRTNSRNPAGTNSTLWPAARNARSTGPKNPLRRLTPGLVNTRNGADSRAANTTRSSRSVRSPSAWRRLAGWPGPSGRASVSRGCTNAAASRGDSLSALPSTMDRLSPRRSREASAPVSAEWRLLGNGRGRTRYAEASSS